MSVFKSPLEARMARKFKEIEKKMKNSFDLIRKDIDEMDASLEFMRKYMRKKEKKDEYARREDIKLRSGFREEVDEFSQKIKQLRVREMEKTLVIKKDLAQIEDSIKRAFKEDIEGFKAQEKEFKGHINDFNKRIAKMEKEKSNGKDKNGKKKGLFFGKRKVNEED